MDKVLRRLPIKNVKYSRNNLQSASSRSLHLATKPSNLTEPTKNNLKRNLFKRYIHLNNAALKDIYFTQDHEWVEVENGIGKVGITDYAQDQLGDVVFCELSELDLEVEQGDAMATIESVKAASDLFAPVSGTVVERNEKVVEDPLLINKSPEDEGWLVKIKLSDDKELSGLLSEEDYGKYKNDHS